MVFTAVCIARLVDAELCRFDQRIVEILPQLEPHFDGGITVASLLAHRSGLGDYIDDDSELPFADMDVAKLDNLEAFLPHVRNAPRFPAGEFRYIQHVLFATPADLPVDVREAKRRVAEDTRARLMAGSLSWAEAASATEEPGGPEILGSLGVIGRGEMVPPFEDAAYGLAPGQISRVTQTTFGYHVIRRPPLCFPKPTMWNVWLL